MTTLFSKLLTKADIENGLSIPASTLGPLPFQEGQSMNMHVHDGNGQEWIFSCSIKGDESVGRFLSVGWIEFARERNLQVDDNVTILEEVMNNRATGTWLKIEVKRKIRLFGKDIWADVK